jgi:hypothetical protein
VIPKRVGYPFSHKGALLSVGWMKCLLRLAVESVRRNCVRKKNWKLIVQETVHEGSVVVFVCRAVCQTICQRPSKAPKASRHGGMFAVTVCLAASSPFCGNCGSPTANVLQNPMSWLHKVEDLFVSISVILMQYVGGA